MTEREQKSFILFLANELKGYCREVLAYQLLAAVLKREGVTGIDKMLAEFRMSPTLETQLNEQFVAVEQFLPTPDEASLDLDIQKLLARWKPIGRPN